MSRSGTLAISAAVQKIRRSVCALAGLVTPAGHARTGVEVRFTEYGAALLHALIVTVYTAAGDAAIAAVPIGDDGRTASIGRGLVRVVTTRTCDLSGGDRRPRAAIEQALRPRRAGQRRD